MVFYQLQSLRSTEMAQSTSFGDCEILSELDNFSVINHNILGFSKHDAIGFVNMDNGTTTFHHIIDENVADRGIDGISCFSGHTNEPIYAIGDIGTPPRIILFSYPNECIGQLKSRIFLKQKHEEKKNTIKMK